jgi:hypothetical protein
VEGHLNKKYKSFLRKTLSAETLSKTVSPDRVLLTKELIVFKLGLEAKSSKAIEISLTYLVVLLPPLRGSSSSSSSISTSPTIASTLPSRSPGSRRSATTLPRPRCGNN